MNQDPRLLLEAARVFNAAGQRTLAEVTAGQALAAVERGVRVTPEIRQTIIGDYVALLLSGRVSGGYPAALRLLDRELGDRRRLSQRHDADCDGSLHMLRVMANGQKYTREVLPESEKQSLRQRVRLDVAFAAQQDPSTILKHRHLWTRGAGPRGEDDLVKIYEDDPVFRKLVSR